METEPVVPSSGYADQGHGLPGCSQRPWPAGMRAPSHHGWSCRVSQAKGWQCMSVVIHSSEIPRKHCEPLNIARQDGLQQRTDYGCRTDAISDGTAVGRIPFFDDYKLAGACLVGPFACFTLCISLEPLQKTVRFLPESLAQYTASSARRSSFS